MPDQLSHFGWDRRVDSQIIDLVENDGVMATTPDHVGVPLTGGPGGRGLDFNTDADFTATGAVAVADDYMNLLIGNLIVTQDDVDADPADNGAAMTFKMNSHDDLGGYWLDLDGDGLLQLTNSRGDSERLAWEDTGTKTVGGLVPGKYLFAVTHAEATGSSSIDVQFQAPGMAALAAIKPADQPGRWESWALAGPYVQNDLEISGDSAIEVAAHSEARFDWMALADGARLTTRGAAMSIETFAIPDQGSATVVTENQVRLRGWTTADAVTLNKQGDGVLILAMPPKRAWTTSRRRRRSSSSRGRFAPTAKLRWESFPTRPIRGRTRAWPRSSWPAARWKSPVRRRRPSCPG